MNTIWARSLTVLAVLGYHWIQREVKANVIEVDFSGHKVCWCSLVGWNTWLQNRELGCWVPAALPGREASEDQPRDRGLTSLQLEKAAYFQNTPRRRKRYFISRKGYEVGFWLPFVLVCWHPFFQEWRKTCLRHCFISKRACIYVYGFIFLLKGSPAFVRMGRFWQAYRSSESC